MTNSGLRTLVSRLLGLYFNRQFPRSEVPEKKFFVWFDLVFCLFGWFCFLVFVLFCFVFETGFLCVSLAVLDLTL